MLRQLALHLGDDVLLAGLRRHFATHRFGTATLADLIASFAAGGADELDDWARRWLGTTGVDTLRVDADCDGEHGSPAARARTSSRSRRSTPSVPNSRVSTSCSTARWTSSTSPRAGPRRRRRRDLGEARGRRLDGCRTLAATLDPPARAAVWNAVQLAAADAEIAPQAALDLVDAAAVDGDTALSQILDWATKTVAERYRPEPPTYARIARLAQRVLAGSPPASNRRSVAARAWIEATDDAGGCGPGSRATARTASHSTPTCVGGCLRD